MGKRGTLQPLHERRITDANFAHCVKLLGSAAAWAEALPDNARLGFNDRNTVQIPVEISLAFVRLHAGEAGELGDACRFALATLEAFRVAGREGEG